MRKSIAVFATCILALDTFSSPVLGEDQLLATFAVPLEDGAFSPPSNDVTFFLFMGTGIGPENQRTWGRNVITLVDDQVGRFTLLPADDPTGFAGVAEWLTDTVDQPLYAFRARPNSTGGGGPGGLESRVLDTRELLIGAQITSAVLQIDSLDIYPERIQGRDWTHVTWTGRWEIYGTAVPGIGNVVLGIAGVAGFSRRRRSYSWE